MAEVEHKFSGFLFACFARAPPLGGQPPLGYEEGGSAALSRTTRRVAAK
jgi:hypothetical protein